MLSEEIIGGEVSVELSGDSTVQCSRQRGEARDAPGLAH